MAESIDIRELNERIERHSGFVTNLMTGMDQVIVGQRHLVESLLIGLLSDGHVLLEGVPGLAKTLAIKTLAQLVDAKFSRIQFTPDLLPADVTGTMIYSQKDEKFMVEQGPVFAEQAEKVAAEVGGLEKAKRHGGILRFRSGSFLFISIAQAARVCKGFFGRRDVFHDGRENAGKGRKNVSKM